MDIDLAELASLVTLLKEADFTEFCYDKGDTHIVVRRGGEISADSTAAAAQAMHNPATAASAQPASAAAPSSASPAQPATAASQAATPATPARVATAAAPTSPQSEPIPGAKVVTAPMLGTFYAAPKPGEPAFVQVGGTVEPDTVVCIIEVMKLMNSIHAEIHGTVVAVHAKNGDLVEFGQPLFSIQETEAP